MCAETPSAEPPLGRLITFFTEKGVLIAQDELQMGKVLGRGASGVTHVATYRGEKVAVKVYSPSVLMHDFVSVRNEMEIMTIMRHENIIDFRGLLLSANPPTAALVTTLAPKGELGNALYKRSSLRRRGDEARFRIAIGMARGLQYLHAHDVIHRDIKPANILLGENYEAKLTDFGYSRFIDQSGVMTGETGSYRYMAPEITRHGRYGPKADVFSFAVVVNEIFCEEHPYEYQLPFDVALGVVKNNLRPGQKRIRNVRLKSIIARAWDSDPQMRPDWEEIISELKLAQEEMAAEKRSGVKGMLLSRLGVSGTSNSFKKQ